MTRVLFLGGGRRVALAERFIAAGCEIYGYELDVHVPLASAAKKVVAGKKWDSPYTEAHIRDACRDNHIDLVVPLDDHGVVVLARTNLDPGVAKSCPGPEAALKAWNKQLFAEHCRAFSPDLYPWPVPGEPSILKPRFGFGSNGVLEGGVFDTDTATPSGYVRQRKLSPPEYTVDCYFNRDGEMVGASPRERLRVAGGEVIESRTVEAPALVAASRRLGEGMGLRGPACVQFMGGSPDGSPQAIEVNSRFGGGSTLSCQAGLDMVDMTLREYVRGEALPAGRYAAAPFGSTGKGYATPGVRMSRSYKDHFFWE